ncbi:MAG: hypothetical protein F2813_07315 [Actinobacteria bacterium]|nr:hypothetical protein [Actinomycetota bacterium]
MPAGILREVNAQPSARPSWSELFYDLVLIGAFLSFGVDFGSDPTWESGLVLALKLMLIVWSWEQAALFFNRFGDPFNQQRRHENIRTALRFAFLVQLVAVICVSLVESSKMALDAFTGDLGFAGAAVVISMALIYELGGRWKPQLRELASLRRNAGLAAGALFIGSGVAAPPLSTALWIAGLAVAMVATFGPGMGSIVKRFPINRSHFSERLALFVLILIGDVFVKTVITVHEETVDSVDVMQLAFVAVAMWMLWAIYEREIASRPMPEGTRGMRFWMLAHYLFAITLLVCSVGLVWYIAPDYQKITGDWIAMVASGGVGVAIGLIALMRLAAGADGARAGAGRLLVISAVACSIGLLAWLATPSNWRVGVGALAVSLVLLNHWRSASDVREVEPG